MSKELQSEKKCKILAIETTGKEASVALINEEGRTSFKGSKDEMSHLKNLMPLIDDMLEECELQIDDVTHIAVSVGPGSFTGIRIGVTSARALAQTLGIKVLAVPTLKSFGEAADLNRLESKEEDLLICPIFDARRNQVYGSGFFLKGKKLEIIADKCYELAEYLEKLTLFLNENRCCKVRFYGDGTIRYKDDISLWREKIAEFISKEIEISFAEEKCLLQNATNCARFALKSYESGKELNYEDLKPVYLRKAEAEMKLEEKLKGAK